MILVDEGRVLMDLNLLLNVIVRWVPDESFFYRGSSILSFLHRTDTIEIYHHFLYIF